MVVQEVGKDMFEGAGRDLLRRAEKKGREEGREAAMLENIRSLVGLLHLSPEQAMDALQVPSQDRERVRQILARPKA